MEPDDIEFVGSAEPTPAAPWEPPPASHLLRGVLAVLVVGAALAWAVTRSSGGGHNPVAVSPPPSAPTSAPAPSTTPATNPVPETDAAVPQDYRATPVGRAVAQYLPHVTITNISFTYTVDSASGLTSSTGELIEAHQDSVELLVQIRPYQHPEPVPTVAFTPTPPGLGSAFFEFETPSSVIDVQWIGTDATPPPVGALRSLADDPRLESLS